ncbi:MAG: hypothetical protein KC910_23995 [Candidatus Eremiobacteraeota bacterium]|nr:hypothetical protein [Candidatus Eremiobacteraeota bacterium]
MKPLFSLLILLSLCAWAQPTTHSFHLRHLTSDELVPYIECLLPESECLVLTPRHVRITSDCQDLVQLVEEIDSPPSHRLAAHLVVLDEVAQAAFGLPSTPSELEVRSLTRRMCNCPSQERILADLAEAGHARFIGSSPAARTVELEVEGLRLSLSLDQRGWFYITRRAFGRKPRHRARRIVAPDMILYCGDLSLLRPDARQALGLPGQCQVWLLVGWSCWNCRHAHVDRALGSLLSEAPPWSSARK